MPKLTFAMIAPAAPRQHCPALASIVATLAHIPDLGIKESPTLPLNLLQYVTF